MKVLNETIQRWTSLKEDGDIIKLALLIGKSKETVIRIFRNKEGKTEYLKKIDNFYKQRQKEYDKIILPWF